LQAHHEACGRAVEQLDVDLLLMRHVSLPRRPRKHQCPKTSTNKN
jgi:hypothetical protein